MSANTSSAVMQQRKARADLELGPRGFPRALDYFPTPPWATRALCEHLTEAGELLGRQTCWEPACGEGHMARPLGESFRSVFASDVQSYHGLHALADFLVDGPRFEAVDWIVTNPPFAMAERFIDIARAKAVRGVAMFVRSAFTEGAARYRDLFSKHPPATVLQFAERVVLLEQRLVRANTPDPFNPRENRGASSATSYCWLIWRPGFSDTRHRWIAPCRERLERPGDYPTYPEHAARAAAEPEGALL